MSTEHCACGARPRTDWHAVWILAGALSIGMLVVALLMGWVAWWVLWT